MSRFTFSKTKDDYLLLRGTTITVNRRKVLVTYHRTESRGGSWERGFRFYNSEWAMLKSAKGLYSMDHGATWHASPRLACKLTRGKLRLKTSNEGELAFNGIQEIARRYEGPGYRWSR